MYLKLLNRFLTSVLFSKDEYNVQSKEFNIARLLVTVFLIGNLFFTIYLVAHMVSVYDVVKATCPTVLIKIKTK